jgi:hypothetical protein
MDTPTGTGDDDGMRFTAIGKHFPPMMVLAMLAVAALACNLGVAVPPTPTRFIVPTPPIIVITSTPPFIPTLPVVIPTSQPIPTQIIPCNPRNDWPLYTVRAGDTLSTIAFNTGTTTAILASANCLSNPDRIEVGQPLRVPRLPTVPTATTASVPLRIRTIAVEPSVPRGVGQFQVTSGNLFVRALDVSGAVRVDFYVQQIGSPTPQAIGTDSNMADGASVVWTLNASNFTAQMWAIAIAANGQQAESARIVILTDVGTAPTIGTLSIAPSSPDPQVPNGLFLQIGPTLISVSTASGANRVIFYFVANTPGATPILLGEDTNLADGIGIVWNTATAPAVQSGLIWAQALNGLGQFAQTASIPVRFF